MWWMTLWFIRIPCFIGWTYHVPAASVIQRCRYLVTLFHIYSISTAIIFHIKSLNYVQKINVYATNVNRCNNLEYTICHLQLMILLNIHWSHTCICITREPINTFDFWYTDVRLNTAPDIMSTLLHLCQEVVEVHTSRVCTEDKGGLDSDYILISLHWFVYWYLSHWFVVYAFQSPFHNYKEVHFSCFKWRLLLFHGLVNVC